MLEVRGESNGLVACFARDLDSEVPRIEGNEDECSLGVEDMVFYKAVDALDCFAERARVLNVIPC